MSKPYIIQVNFLDVHPTEYFAEENGKLVGYFHPGHAQEFTTEEAGEAYVRDNFGDNGKYARVVPKEKAMAAFNQWLESGMKQREWAMKDKTLSRKYAGESPDEILAWRVQQSQAPSNTVDSEDYRTWPELSQVFKCLRQVQCYHSPDWKSQYLSFQLKVDYDTKQEELEEELAKVLPLVTYQDDMGNKIFDVIDHNLGEGGDSVDLKVHTDGTYSLEGRWGTPVKGPLKKVFAYWKENRPLEQDPNREREDIDGPDA